MFRFLLTRRWIGLFLVVIVVGFTCVELGLWQFRRYHERQHSNAVTTTNLKAAPIAVSGILSTNAEPASGDEWRVVRTTGTYDAKHQVVVLYRSVNSQPGIEVVVPLVTPSGTAVLVDRGWVPSVTNGNLDQHPPAPPAGRVTVTGWVRIDATDASNLVTPVGGAVRSISAAAIKTTLPYPAYDGFVALIKEQPSVKNAPLKSGGPDLGSGPYFFYGVQWFFFALLGFGFWCYFGWAEYQEVLRARAAPDQVREPVTAAE
ncbi:MAG: SURF1 family cytochrome oxidase biogenesis protein [Nocardioidaceae bacterium]